MKGIARTRDLAPAPFLESVLRRDGRGQHDKRRPLLGPVLEYEVVQVWAMPCRRHDARTSSSISAKVRPGYSAVTSSGSEVVRFCHHEVDGRSGIPAA